MPDVLSQDEIDALLEALSSGSLDIEEIKKEETRKIKVYDFRRPDKFSKDQIRGLQMIHESFARILTTNLSARVRSVVQMKVVSVDQVTYEEFTRSLFNPTVLVLFSLEPLEGTSVLEINPALMFSIIDRLLGGRGEPLKKPRELTDIEITVVKRLIDDFLLALQEAWGHIVELRLKVEGLENNPQFVQVAPPNDMTAVVTIDTKIGEVEGMMNLCFPYFTLEPIVPKLSAQYWFSAIRKETPPELTEHLKKKLEKVKIPVKVELGSSSITVGELLDLEVGDVILLRERVDSLVTVKIGDKEKFKGRVGTLGKKLAVRVEAPVEKEEEF
ncbi:MAG: flagellar motor switch protein FliM [Synergistetes bacterium]|nr:MAG: Flagellar motor switch protein FliM [bacterium 42_11]MBC7331008.1 flagellar motor switch protein FliM [Synergistota bacterium]MDK2871601.1 flagellar motor switch protein FliM [bacterium]